MENKRQIILRTYAKTWDFDYIIYGYGDFTLPFQLKLTDAGFFVIAFFIVNILTIPIPVHISLLYKFAAAIGMTYLAVKLDIDGKKPYIWIPRQVVYLIRLPKTWNKFKPITRRNAFSFNQIRKVDIK